jgi:hypothetical protein
MRYRYYDDGECCCPAATAAAEEASNNAVYSTAKTRGDTTCNDAKTCNDTKTCDVPTYNAAKICSAQNCNSYSESTFGWHTETFCQRACDSAAEHWRTEITH